MYEMKSLSKLAIDLESYYGTCPKRAAEIKIWTRIPFKKHLPAFLFEVHSKFASDDWIQVTFWIATLFAIFELSIGVIEMYKILKDQEYQPDSKLAKIFKNSSINFQRNSSVALAVANIIASILLIFGILRFKGNYNMFWILVKFIIILITSISIAFERSLKNCISLIFYIFQIIVVMHVTMIISESTFKISFM